MNINELIGAVFAGDFDDHLPKIQEAIKSRSMLANSRSLIPGTMVTAHGLRPKYICGKPARVLRVNNTTVSVVFDPPVRNGAKVWRECRIPLSNLTVISTAVVGGS